MKKAPDGMPYLPITANWLPRGARAWKMVDAEHADSVASGVLRIGTLNSYKELENGRADPGEGRLLLKSGTLKFTGADDPPTVRMAARVGIKHPPQFEGNVTVVNATVIDLLAPSWAFCMAEEGCDFDWTPKKPKAIFEIADPHELVKAIVTCLQPSLRDYSQPGRVEYLPTLVDVETNFDRFVSPFVKAPDFAVEREIRVMFNPRDELEASLKPIFTPPLPEIASLLRRVR